MNSSETRCGFVAVVGEPNAGKSTLINLMVGEKVSIVSPKCQTTRRAIRGIVEYDRTQVIFVDTPGFFKSRTNLEKVLVSNFKHSYKDSDIILVLIDANTNYSLDYTFSFIEKLSNRKVAVVLNKVDIAPKENILKIAQKMSKYDFIDHIFMISALKGIGVDEVRSYLRNSLPRGPYLYDAEQKTDMNMEFRLSEITREKIYKILSAELPYNIYVETEMFHEAEKKAKIFQSIVVMKDSQKGIVLGKDGARIKAIKDAAILDMKGLLRKKIELKLFVKVKEGWVDKKSHLQNAGIIDA